MQKTFFTFFLCLNLAGFFNSCECPPERYFDYTAIALGAHNPIVEKDEILTMFCAYENLYYLTNNKIRHNAFAMTAYATSVCEKGYDGDKYSKVSVTITSDSDFSATHPSGTNLASLVKVYGTDSSGERVQKLLIDFQPHEVELGFMTIESRPEIDKSHVFTIVVEKSNGEVLSATCPEVVWQ